MEVVYSQNMIRYDMILHYIIQQYNNTIIYLMSITSGKVAHIPQARAHVRNTRLKLLCYDVLYCVALRCIMLCYVLLCCVVMCCVVRVVLSTLED